MSDLRREIVGHLPCLRRYARALAGSQVRGDACVGAALEALIAEPGRIAEGEEVRVQLYRLFHDVWATLDPPVPRASETEVPDELEGAGKRLSESIAALPSRPRQVLLLSSLEGFGPSDIARILRTDAAVIVSLLAEAREDLRRQAGTSVLIIEDDRLVALQIADIVRDSGHRVAGFASSSRDAEALARRLKPGLVLADVRLEAGTSGLEAARSILASLSVPVIFVTAFPEALLTGETVEPTWLVTKPFSPDTLKVTISQALLFRPAADAVPAPS